VIHLSKSVAIEYAMYNIRVNAICPSVVETPLLRHFMENAPDPEGARRGFATLNPMPGMVTVDAVARAALFLVSDDSSFITAVALPIDGGYTAR
jgi:NAD(P)-dependent dehydrogenase (short-subunit alcohol dehydrogenase family)